MAVQKQFTLNDKSFVKKDARFWETLICQFLDMYSETKTDTEDDREAKAVICAKIAGAALAVHEHFSNGIESLSSLDSGTIQEHGMTAHSIAMRHNRITEGLAEKALS